MPLIALFMIAIVSWVIVQSGATALMMTGLSRSVAEFQAISCFFGVGFTTAEAEIVVSHPVRRRIAAHLIVTGNIGLTSAVGALVVAFMDNESDLLHVLFKSDEPVSFWTRLGAAVLGIVAIFLFFRLGFVKRPIEWTIKKSLEKTHAIRAMDYETVLRADQGFAVMQVEIEPLSWCAGRTLAGAQLGSRGVLVLWIRRADRSTIEQPLPTTDIRVGDMLTVYGQEDVVRRQLGHHTTHAS